MRGLRTPRSPLLPPRAEVGGARVAMPGIHCVALPPRFHSALLDLAEERWGWGVAAHGPYGAPLPPPLPSGWHNTSDYALEPLFHARAQRSHEPDAAAATAVYAPYYAGLALRLLGPARAAALEAELLEELALSSAWVRGRPHADPNPNPNPDPNPSRNPRPNPKSNPDPNPEPEPEPNPDPDPDPKPNPKQVRVEGSTRPTVVAQSLGLRPGQPFRWDGAALKELQAGRLF